MRKKKEKSDEQVTTRHIKMKNGREENYLLIEV